MDRTSSMVQNVKLFNKRPMKQRFVSLNVLSLWIFCLSENVVSLNVLSLWMFCFSECFVSLNVLSLGMFCPFENFIRLRAYIERGLCTCSCWGRWWGRSTPGCSCWGWRGQRSWWTGSREGRWCRTLFTKKSVWILDTCMNFGFYYLDLMAGFLVLKINLNKKWKIYIINCSIDLISWAKSPSVDHSKYPAKQ